MNQQLSDETQYFFDLTDKQWWVLPKSEDQWKELSNEEAYKLGLFKAVFSQKCNFIDTNLSQYDEAVSNLLKEFDEKFSLNKQKSLNKISYEVEQRVTKVLTKDFSKDSSNKDQYNNYDKDKDTNKDKYDGEMPQLKSKKSEQFVKFKEESTEYSEEAEKVESVEQVEPLKSNKNKIEVEKNSTTSNNKTENNVVKEGGTENLLSQINSLIASTTQMKQMCKAKELSAQNKANAPTVRSTARHLTYVNNGGLAGCLKTVAEERKKVGNTKKPVKQPQNTQLQEMIQRAKAMAAKTIDEVKEPEPVAKAKKEPQAKKTQLRSNAKRYTTVFGAAALKDLRLNQQLPDVTFEGSSDDDSDDEKRK